jgi:hypothetical protein
LKQIFKTLDSLINQGESLKKEIKQGRNISVFPLKIADYYYSQKINRWVYRVNIFLKENISTEVAVEFNNECRGIPSIDWYENICNPLNSGIIILESIKNDIDQNPKFWENYFSKNKTIQKTLSHPEINSSIYIVRKICSQFHIVAKQLGNYRHENRNTITITDEYDVQDLLHALLKIFFDDIRPEEYTPSYAGGSSRIDFLIKSEKIAIETKKTRKGLKRKEIADQLIIDIDRYKAAHPDCEILFCFVYDPENFIQNPIGFEKDINEKHKGEAEVLVCPKGL